MLRQLCKRTLCDTRFGNNNRDKILKNTDFTREHLVPEIGIHLVTPNSEIWHRDFEIVQREFFSEPYWAFFWPGGQGLTRYVLDRPDLVNNRSVLDLGCGCGANAVAVGKMKNAARILANDIDPVAIEAAKLNAEMNRVTGIEFSEEDLLTDSKTNERWAKMKSEFEVLLIGDLFFDESIAKATLKFIDHFWDEDKVVLIGDPGRWFLNDPNNVFGDFCLDCVAKYELCEDSKIENNGLCHCFVYKVRKNIKSI